MTTLKHLVIILLQSLPVFLIGQNDCSEATILCNSGQVVFNPIGPGFNDFNNGINNDGCLSGEHSSAWYYFEIAPNSPANAVLAFTITPNNQTGNEDFDFALFGPNVLCGSLGGPIRCSYADDNVSGPLTGLSDINPTTGGQVTDVSEGAAGDGFVTALPVSPGQGFYLIVDNFNNSGNGFNIDFTGSALLNCSATQACDFTVNAGLNITRCQGQYGKFLLGGSLSGALDTVSYDWSPSNFLNNSHILNPIVNIPLWFTGNLTYILSVTNNGCVKKDTITVTVTPGNQIFFSDVDGDGFGNPSSVVHACALPSGYVINASDCNDNIAAINPGVTEICNGKDDNCNGQIDEAPVACSSPTNLAVIVVSFNTATLVWHTNPCAEAYQFQFRPLGSLTWILKTIPEGSVNFLTLNNLSSGTIYQWQIRSKCSTTNFSTFISGANFATLSCLNALPLDVTDIGQSTATLRWLAVTGALGYKVEYRKVGTSNWTIKNIPSGAQDSLKIIGLTVSSEYEWQVRYKCANNVFSNWVPGQNFTTLPWMVVFQDNDGDGFGDPLLFTEISALPPPYGFVINTQDCNDSDPLINPAMHEVCNTMDDNCDGLTDNVQLFQDADGDGIGAGISLGDGSCLFVPQGFSLVNTDCAPSDAAIYPGAVEICDGIDENCNGVIDDDMAVCPLSSDISISDISTMTVTFNWSEVVCAEGFKVQYQQKTPIGGNYPVISQSILQPAINFSLNNLLPGTNYQWRMQTLCPMNKKSVFSDWMQFSTLEMLLNQPLGEAIALSGQGMTVFPNPSDGRFYIQFLENDLDPVSIVITDWMCKRVFEGQLSIEPMAIDLSDQPDGFYLLNVKLLDGRVVKGKIMKQ